MTFTPATTFHVIQDLLDKRRKRKATKKIMKIEIEFLFNEKVPVKYRIAYLRLTENEKAKALKAYKEDVDHNVF